MKNVGRVLSRAFYRGFNTYANNVFPCFIAGGAFYGCYRGFQRDLNIYGNPKLADKIIWRFMIVTGGFIYGSAVGAVVSVCFPFVILSIPVTAFLYVGPIGNFCTYLD